MACVVVVAYGEPLCFRCKETFVLPVRCKETANLQRSQASANIVRNQMLRGFVSLQPSPSDQHQPRSPDRQEHS